MVIFVCDRGDILSPKCKYLVTDIYSCYSWFLQNDYGHGWLVMALKITRSSLCSLLVDDTGRRLRHGLQRDKKNSLAIDLIIHASDFMHIKPNRCSLCLPVKVAPDRTRPDTQNGIHCPTNRAEDKQPMAGEQQQMVLSLVKYS